MKIGMKQYESEAKARMNKSNPPADTTSPSSTNEAAVVSYETQMNGGHENGHVSNGVIHS